MTEISTVQLTTILNEDNTKKVGRGHPCRVKSIEGRVRINRILETEVGHIWIELTDNDGEIIPGLVRGYWVRAW